jgi:hypothetical protein
MRVSTFARTALFGAILTMVASVPAALSAQSQLDTAEAQAFLGNWDLTVQSDMGPADMDLLIDDRAGKLGVQMGSAEMGGLQEVTDVMKMGDDLHLTLQVDMQGQVIPIMVVLSTTDTGIDANINVADGMFTARGSGTRAD